MKFPHQVLEAVQFLASSQVFSKKTQKSTLINSIFLDTLIGGDTPIRTRNH